VELFNRATRRAHSLAVALAIAYHQRVDDRLLLTLWHLAERWGRVRPEGIAVRLRLSHQQWADLVGAHRPSVTTETGDLGRADAVGAKTGPGRFTGLRRPSCATIAQSPARCDRPATAMGRVKARPEAAGRKRHRNALQLRADPGPRGMPNRQRAQAESPVRAPGSQVVGRLFLGPLALCELFL
jgi:Crp-like helix-turn-helix domain